MVTHSNILAWKIPWTGAWWATVHEVERVGHDLAGTHTGNRWFVIYIGESKLTQF